MVKLAIHPPSLEAGTPLPLFSSTVEAGFPSPSGDQIEHALDLNELLITHPAATFFVRVQGNSMSDAGILSSDVLIVDRSLSPKDKSIVIAVLNGEFTVKRLVKKEGKIFLSPENPAFKPIEIKGASDFLVWGVVTYVIHKAR